MQVNDFGDIIPYPYIIVRTVQVYPPLYYWKTSGSMDVFIEGSTKVATVTFSECNDVYVACFYDPDRSNRNDLIVIASENYTSWVAKAGVDTFKSSDYMTHFTAYGKTYYAGYITLAYYRQTQYKSNTISVTDGSGSCPLTEWYWPNNYEGANLVRDCSLKFGYLMLYGSGKEDNNTVMFCGAKGNDLYTYENGTWVSHNAGYIWNGTSFEKVWTRKSTT